MLMKLTDYPLFQRIGIDISQEKFNTCLRKGDSLHHAEFAMSGRGMDQFRQWLKKYGVDCPHLWMEATGRYFEPLAEWATKRNWKVTIANPRSIKQFSVSTLKTAKTDKLDARTILRFAEAASDEEIRFWSPKSAAFKSLRDIQMEISGLKKMIGQERNRLKCGLSNNFVREKIREIIDFLTAKLAELRREAMRVIKSDPELSHLSKQLKTIKGFGDVTITVLLAKIDFDLFSKGRQLVKFAGLHVDPWESGKIKKRQQCISRMGHADLRSALYLPALAAMKHDPRSIAIAEQLEKRGNSKKQIICALMARLLRVAFAVVRDSKRARLEVSS